MSHSQKHPSLSLRNMTNISWLLSPKRSGVWVGIAAGYRFLPSAESLILQLSPEKKIAFILNLYHYLFKSFLALD